MQKHYHSSRTEFKLDAPFRCDVSDVVQLNVVNLIYNAPLSSKLFKCKKIGQVSKVKKSPSLFLHLPQPKIIIIPHNNPCYNSRIIYYFVYRHEATFRDTSGRCQYIRKQFEHLIRKVEIVY